jgi:hypothetical protein
LCWLTYSTQFTTQRTQQLADSLAAACLCKELKTVNSLTVEDKQELGLQKCVSRGEPEDEEIVRLSYDAPRHRLNHNSTNCALQQFEWLLVNVKVIFVLYKETRF